MGMSKMNNTHGEKDYRAAYYYLGKAASRGHVKAREEMAIAMMFGDHVARNITGSREIFEDLSLNKASPRAQFFLGFFSRHLVLESNQIKQNRLLISHLERWAVIYLLRWLSDIVIGHQ